MIPTPEQHAEFLAKKAEQKASRYLGKVAEQAKAAIRLAGRTLRPDELERQAVKQFKRKQKRMELLNKSHYPTPKHLNRKQMRKVS